MQYDKIGFYIELWQAIKGLSSNHWDVRMESLGDLCEYLKEGAHSSGRARAQAFPGLCAFWPELKALSDRMLADIPEEQDVNAAIKALEQEKRSRLGNEIATIRRRLSDVFRNQVENREVYLSPERQSLLAFLSPEQFLRDVKEVQRFRSLPQIAQQNFADAGKCLVYGLPGATVSLSLQAVEATIRYYWFRHGGRQLDTAYQRGGQQDWGSMTKWLKAHSVLPGNNDDDRDSCFREFERLRKDYRNVSEHARGLFETNQPEANLSMAEDILRKCLEVANMLAAETQRRPQLRLNLKVCANFTLDAAVATWLFSWDPEYPPLAVESVVFDSSLPDGTIKDDTFRVVLDTVCTDRRTIQPISVDSKPPSLSRAVVKHLGVQENAVYALEPLLQFVEACNTGSAKINPDDSRVLEEGANLLHLFYGLQYKCKKDGHETFRMTWDVLDRLAAMSVSPYGPYLLTELQMTSMIDDIHIACIERLTNAAS